MPKYKVIMCYPDGSKEEDDEICDTYAEAEEYAWYLCSCYEQGGAILNMSNPGDYPLSDDKADYEIIEIDD